MHGRQERAVPERRPDGRRDVRAQHDVAGQVLVVGPQTVGQPGPERRPADLGMAGVHHEHRRLMIRDVRVDGADEADVVGARADVREQFAHVHSALAVLLERERRAQQRTGLAFGGDAAAGQRLPVILVEHRLGIEAVHLRQPAVHEQEDDVFRFGRVMKSAGRTDLRVLVRAAQRRGCRQRLPDQSGKREHAEAIANPAERLATGHGVTGFMAHDSSGPAKAGRYSSIHEEKLVRAQEHFHVAPERRDRQQLLLRRRL